MAVKKVKKEESDLYSGYLTESEKGPQRSFFKTTPSSKLYILLSSYSRLEKYSFLSLIIVTLFVRLYCLDYPDSVVFDEVHFLGFASKYINGTYFVDVHPPLVKLIFYFICKLMGYDGSFDYSKIGNRYLDSEGNSLAPYVTLRIFTALCGVGTVLLTYKTAKLSGCRPLVCFFGVALCCFENSLITQSRYILLDSPLILFISLAMFSYQLLKICEPFSKSWLRYLCLLGFSLSLSISSKWVGFLTMFFIGILTVKDFWYLVGDLTVSTSDLRKHFGSRFYFLIITPIIIYMGAFAVHFINLPLVGDGTSHMSPQFQNTLQNSIIHDFYQQISLGSTVSLRHVGTSGYLHSHDATYPKTGHQQVTLYGYQDSNNDWLIEPKDETGTVDIYDTIHPIPNFSRIKLFHQSQQRYLRVNDERPPISQQDYDNEVTLIGDANYTGDGNNEVFELRMVTDRSKLKPEFEFQLQAIDSVFQIFHIGTGCYLFSHDEKLPKWGFNQNEVICIESPTLENSLWYFEKNTHPVLEKDPNAEKVDLPPMSFWSKFLEVHKVMVRMNNGLTEEHNAASDPISWPFLIKGVGYWGEDNRGVYLLGNYIIYWLIVVMIVSFATLLVIMCFPFLKPSYFTLEKPGITNPNLIKFICNNSVYVLGWLIHYIPFFFMHRQLYLHHYLPSVYFGILVITQTFEFITSKNRYIGYLLMLGVTTAVIYVFHKYAPLVYALNWSVKECMQSKVLKSWTMNCFKYK